MRKYQAYRDTGEAWLRSVPQHWRVFRIKHLFAETSIKGRQGEPQLVASQQDGVVLKDNYGARTVEALKGTDGFKFVKRGDFVISLRSFQGGIEYAHCQGVISPAYTILELKNDSLDQLYFRYLAKAVPFIRLLQTCVTGIREGQNVSYEMLRKHLIPVPPLVEQAQIVRYLDAATARIDALVRQYERLVELLAERKIAVISQAVTKGLHADVPMKDSGVAWIGEIPAHWRMSTVKQHFRIKKEIAGREGFDILAVTQHGIKKKDVASNAGQVAMDYSNYQFVHPGEFVMNHMDLLTGYLDISPYFGVTSPDYRVFVMSDENQCVSEYYLRYFQIGYHRKIFYKFGRGAASKGRWRLPARNFYELPIPLPPKEEQPQIVAYIDSAIKQTDKAIQGIKKQIDLLKERRARLISDLVTGQVDVRE